MKRGETTRLRLTLHYDGSGFRGWQFQPDQRTVQGELQEALARLAGPGRSVMGSGRTDTGVHATGQVAAVDLPVRWSAAELKRALNAVLPADIWVQDARRVRPDFHPRYDATARTYEYRVGLVEEARSPFHRGWCWPLCTPLDTELLGAGATAVVGTHAFGAFAKAGQPERGERCTVQEARWSPWALGVAFRIQADRYLHRMVRYLVGTMIDVARGRRPHDDVRELLAGAPDLGTSPPAPPEGLFLLKVEYPDDVGPSGPPPHPDRRSTAPRS